MSKDRLAEIYTQMKPLAIEAEDIVNKLDRAFIEELTGLKVPEEVKNISFCYSTENRLKPTLCLVFNDSIVYRPSGHVHGKYLDFTFKIDELMGDPAALITVLEKYHDSIPHGYSNKVEIN